MAARTLESGYFGSVGMSDPLSSFVERTLRVAWDFGRKAVPENKTIPLMQLPKGFLIDRISVVQTKALNAAVVLTFGLASDDSVVVGGNFALGASADTLLRSSQAPKNATASDGSSGMVAVESGMFVAAGDILCMIVPDGVTGDELNDGAFDLCIHGFDAFADGVAANPLDVESYRLPLQSAENEEANVSGGQFPQDIND